MIRRGRPADMDLGAALRALEIIRPLKPPTVDVKCEPETAFDGLSSWSHEAADGGGVVAVAIARDLVATALNTLRPRRATALRMRFGIGCKEHTLTEIGQEFGVSSSRACQVVEHGLRDLRHPQFRRRLRLTRAAFMLLLAGCSFSPSGGAGAAGLDDGGLEVDAGRLVDAGVELDSSSQTADAAIDAAGVGRPIGDACDLFADQCALGLGCRYTGGGPTRFQCSPAGAGGQGASCDDHGGGNVDLCGPRLGCFPVAAGHWACMTFCETTNPGAYCSVGLQCYHANGLPGAYPENTGVCG